MQRATSIATVAGGLGSLLLATTLWAGPTIQSWELQRDAQGERLLLSWSDLSAYEIHEFPAAQQVVLTLPEAALPSKDLDRLNTADSLFLQKAKLQDVTLPDGRGGVQLTVNLDRWASITPKATKKAMVLTFKEAAPATPAGPVELSDDAIAEMERYGSAYAPATGAGQAPAAPGQDAAFYVPPNLTPEERQAADLGNNDLGMLTTMSILDRQVDLDFKNAELQDVIRLIATKLGLNIILAPGQVDGRVTVTLRSVRLGDALDSLLKANNLSYKIESGGIVRIVPREEVRARDVETEVRSIAINWVSASELATTLEPFLGEEGSIEFSQMANVLIVEDVPEKVAQVQDLVARLDVPEKQVRMEVRLVDMTENASRAMGFRTGFTEQDNNLATGGGIDGRVIQNPEAGGGFGTGESVTDDDLLYFPESSGAAGLLPVGADALQARIFQDISIFGNEYLLDMELNAQENRGEAATLANPTILSLNNVPANIEIKRQIPYQDAQNTTQGSVATIKFADVGTLVQLTPRITNNGYVQMAISTEQKIDTGQRVLGVPVIDERFSNTAVIVKDDQTVVLGGLRQFETSFGESGVPWLLRLPVLGWAFKQQTQLTNNVELFLFVTPHVLKSPDPTTYEMSVYDKIDYNWDLPDYFFDQELSRESPGEDAYPGAKWY